MERCRVLVIEDDDALKDLLTDVLDGEGYAVTAADAALGAPVLVRDLRPHTIVLDVGLPYRSGASLLAELKADPRTAPIPVVVVTGLPEAVTAGRLAPANAVIAKPFELHVLLDAVRAACITATVPAPAHG
jgi:DNA-binding response OmpR family regulator